MAPRQRQVRPTGPLGGPGVSRVQFTGDQRPQQGLLDRFMKVAELGSKVAVHEIGKVVEADKIKQIDRFNRGKAPSDDATLAGYRAAGLLYSNESIKRQEAILLDKSANFTGTPGEWNAEVMKSKDIAYEEAVKNSPNLLKDQQFQKAQALMFEDSYSTVAQRRVIDGLKIERAKRLTSFGRSAVDILNSDTPDTTDDLNRLVNVYAPALQLSPKEVIPMMEEVISNDLNNGNLNGLLWSQGYIVDESNNLSMFDTSPTLQNSLRNAQSIKRTKYKERLNKDFNDLIVRAQEEGMATEDFVIELGNQKTYDNEHSAHDAQMSRAILASEERLRLASEKVDKSLLDAKNSSRRIPEIQNQVLAGYSNLMRRGMISEADSYIKKAFKDYPIAMSLDNFSQHAYFSTLTSGEKARVAELAKGRDIPVAQRAVKREYLRISREEGEAAAASYLVKEIAERPVVMSDKSFSQAQYGEWLELGKKEAEFYDDSNRHNTIVDNTEAHRLAREALSFGTPEARAKFTAYMTDVTTRRGGEGSAALQSRAMKAAEAWQRAEAKKVEEGLKKEAEARWIGVWKPHYGRILGKIGNEYVNEVISDDELAIQYNEVMKDKAARGYAHKEAWGLSKWESILKMKRGSDKEAKKLQEWDSALMSSETLLGQSGLFSGMEASGVRYHNSLVNKAIQDRLPGQDITDNKKNVFDVRYEEKSKALKLYMNKGVYDKDLANEFKSFPGMPLDYIAVNSKDMNLQSAPWNVTEKLKLYRDMSIPYRQQLIKDERTLAFWDNLMAASEGATLEGGIIPEGAWQKAWTGSHNTSATAASVEADLRVSLEDIDGSDILASGSLFQKSSLNETQENFLEAQYASFANREKGFGVNNADVIMSNTEARMNRLFTHSDAGNVIQGDRQHINGMIFGKTASPAPNNYSAAIDIYLDSLGPGFENSVVAFNQSSSSITIFDSDGVNVRRMLIGSEVNEIREAFLANNREYAATVEKFKTRPDRFGK